MTVRLPERAGGPARASTFDGVPDSAGGAPAVLVPDKHRHVTVTGTAAVARPGRGIMPGESFAVAAALGPQRAS